MKAKNLFFFFIFLSLFLCSCLDESGTRNRPLRPKSSIRSTERIDSGSNQSAKSEIFRRGLRSKSNQAVSSYDFNAETIFFDLVKEAEFTLIVVESNSPDWLESYLLQVSKEKPFLKVLYFNKKGCRGLLAQNNCFQILNLKASFVIVDRQYLLINPLYDTSTKGIQFLVVNRSTIDQYLNFVKNLF